MQLYCSITKTSPPISTS